MKAPELASGAFLRPGPEEPTRAYAPLTDGFKHISKEGQNLQLQFTILKQLQTKFG